MNVANLPMAGSVAQTAPRHIPDLRPSADAAGLRHQSRPPGGIALPGLPLPPGASQSVAVSRALLVADGGAGDQVAAPERVLKPYGVQMLPGAEPQPRAPTAADPQAGPTSGAAAELTVPPAIAMPVRAEPTRAEARSITEAKVQDSPPTVAGTLVVPVIAGASADPAKPDRASDIATDDLPIPPDTDPA